MRLWLNLYEFLGIQDTSYTYFAYIYGFFPFNEFFVISFFLSVKCGENEIMYVKCPSHGRTSVFRGSCLLPLRRV